MVVMPIRVIKEHPLTPASLNSFSISMRNWIISSKCYPNMRLQGVFYEGRGSLKLTARFASVAEEGVALLRFLGSIR